MTIDNFLEQDQAKGLLRVLTAGSVDDGKSTLIGRLLFDSKRLYEDQLQALKTEAVKRGDREQDIDYSLLCDGLKAEREQGITIDVAYRYFATSQRKFIIADTPGHEQYTRNMITGGSTADVAILLVDARQGVVTQTRRHSYIVALLGIKHIILAVNKMDLVAYSKERFNEIVKSYTAFSHYKDFVCPKIVAIPISAINGENVVKKSHNMPWYRGQSLLQTLERIEIDRQSVILPFRLPIQIVLRPNHTFRGFAGKIASGVIRPADRVKALPSGQESTVKQIVSLDGDLPYAVAGQSVTITLTEQIDLSRGQMLVRIGQSEPTISHHITAFMVWMDCEVLDSRKTFYLKHNTNTVRARIEKIHYCIDVNTSEKAECNTLTLNSIAKVDICALSPIITDIYYQNRACGSFIIIDPITNFTSAVGMVVEARPSNSKSRETITISLSQLNIDTSHREAIESVCRAIEQQTGITIKSSN